MKFAFLMAVNLTSLTAVVFIGVPAFAQRDSCCCALPLGDTTPGLGRRIPRYADLFPEVSPDMKRLAIIDGEHDSAWVIDLETLARTPILIKNEVDKVDYGVHAIAWCPYDPDLLVASVVLTDSVYPGLNQYGDLYEYRTSTGDCARVTPEVFGPVGDTSEVLQLNTWRSNSKNGNDTLEIGSWSIQRDSTVLYIPETQKIVRPPWFGELRTMAQSRSGNHSFFAVNTKDYEMPPYFVDTISLASLDSSVQFLGWASFSPDEKLLALSAAPNGQGPPADSVFPQVWIYRVDSPGAPPIVINFQKSFCMYSFWGIYAEFITDSTLAVSMHKDGDISSPLWEITLDGRIVRQLTFLPELPDGVTLPLNSTGSLRVFPTPARSELEIVSGPLGTVRLFDLLGREVLETNVDGSGTALNVSKLPAGTYFLRLGTQSAKVVIAR